MLRASSLIWFAAGGGGVAGNDALQEQGEQLRLRANPERLVHGLHVIPHRSHGDLEQLGDLAQFVALNEQGQ